MSLIIPSWILTLAFSPGLKIVLQDLQIKSRILRSALTPCRFDTLSKSLAAKSEISLSEPTINLDRWLMESSALFFLFFELRPLLRPVISTPHKILEIARSTETPTWLIEAFPSMRISNPLSEYQSANGAV